MSLRWKIIAVVAATAIVIIGAVSAVSQLTFDRSFQAIERANTEDMVTRTQNALSDRINSLHTLNHDWAAWDDTYNFVQRPDENQNYIIVNPTDTTFANAGLNFMFIIDLKGHPVFSKGLDLDNNQPMAIPDSLNARILDDFLLRHDTVDDSKKGLILLPEGLLLLSSQPIITSEGKGPVVGTIIMARYWDSRVTDSLVETMKLPVSVLPENAKNMPPEFEIARDSLSDTRPVFTFVLSSNSTAGYALVDDIYGKPAAILKAVVPRDAYTKSAASTKYFIISLFLLATLVGYVFYYSIGRLVLSRVTRIVSYVSNIRTSGDLSKRLSTKGSDELSILERGIDNMVEKLQQSQEMLRLKQQGEERLLLTIESVADGLIETNMQSVIVKANDAASRLCGCKNKDELLGKDFFDIIGTEDREAAVENEKRVLELGHIDHIEYTLSQQGGRTLPIELAAATLSSVGGKPVGFVISFRDISERKKAEINLRAQKELIDRTLATTPNMVLVIGRDDKITLANKAFRERFGKTEWAEGKSLNDTIPVESLAEEIAKTRMSGIPNIKFEFKYALGEHENLLVASLLKMRDDEVLLILNDVTEERDKQRQLYLTDRLASIGQLASGIAHEINNPLTSVIGFSDLLLSEEISDSLREYLLIINKEAHRTAEIVKGLLTFARDQTNGKEPVDLNEIIQAVLKMRTYEQQVHNIKVDTQFGILPRIDGNFAQLQQVFLNIIINAEQAMKEANNRGQLTIITQQISEIVRVTISDDGPGINKTNMQKLFTPFFTTKEVGKGTGLGLSICHGIITEHDGLIYAQSEPGKGATFIIELPVA